MDTALSERSTRVVSFAKLHRSAHRRAVGEFLVEGANAVGAALQAGAARVVLVRASDADRNESLTDRAQSQGVDVLPVTDRAADKLADTTTTPGIFAVCGVLDAELDDVTARPGAVVVAVDMSEPGNAGTLVRTADAMGCAGVVLAGDAVDPHNGKCVRASAGSVFHLPLARVRDTASALDALRTAGYAILATAADGEVSLDDLDAAGASGVLGGRVAWLMGNEAHGLTDAVLAAADHRVSIPIRGAAESLNIAAAAAMCLYVGARAHAGVAPAADRVTSAIPVDGPSATAAPSDTLGGDRTPDETAPHEEDRDPT